MRKDREGRTGDTDKEFSVRGSRWRRVILSQGIQEPGRSRAWDELPLEIHGGDPGRRPRYTMRSLKVRRVLKDESPRRAGGVGLPRGATWWNYVPWLSDLAFLFIPPRLITPGCTRAESRRRGTGRYVGMTFLSAAFAARPWERHCGNAVQYQERMVLFGRSLYVSIAVRDFDNSW